MSRRTIAIAAIIVVTLVIIALWVRKSRAAPAEHLLVDDPATPRAWDAVQKIRAGAARFAQIGGELKLPLVASMARINKQIAAMPPLFSNYFGLHSALNASAPSLLAAAAQFEQMGRDEHQKIARGEGEAPALAHLGNQYLEMGAQLREICASVESLGRALEL